MQAKAALDGALAVIFAEMGVERPQKLTLEAPREAKFGDLSTNAAMLLAKAAGQKPRDLAVGMAGRLRELLPEIEQAEVAGPGFINVTFKPTLWQAVILDVEKAGPAYGRTNTGGGKKVLVEYVSANPTGPLHVGHGRGAALGDSVARLLRAAGYDVATEYYLNDAGLQMRKLGQSIWLRLLQARGRELDFPADCYQGQYICDLAAELAAAQTGLSATAEDDATVRCQAYGMEAILNGIKADLAAFGCGIDRYASEAALVESGAVAASLERLAALGKSFESEGALWLRTTEQGDDRDRVLRKSDGFLTYFGTDIAYHHDKFVRGHEWLIDVWGADHHGYIPRMRAAIADMGHDPASFSVLLVQLVNLLRNGEAVSMSTRSGEFVTLAEVLKEVGADAARFMFLSRSSDSPLDFDLELAKKRSMDNPVYYVQYAHARVCSLLERAAERGIVMLAQTQADVLARLAGPEDLALLRMLAAFPDLVANAAKNMAPQHISKYLLELSALLHSYYAKFQIIDEEDGQGSLARLALLRAAGVTLANGLALLGVSAPERM